MGNNSGKTGVLSVRMTEKNPAESSTKILPKKDFSAMFRVSNEEVSSMLKLSQCSNESQENEWQCPICLSIV